MQLRFATIFALTLAGCLELADEVPHAEICELPDSEGKACDDGDPCTAYDACKNEVCVGFSLPEGSPCDDGDACTLDDTCHAGACTGPVLDCSDLDSACELGVCNGETGACEVLQHPEGSPCDDGDLCTLPGECVLGACSFAEPVDCSHLSGTCTAGACNPDTGNCVQSNLPNDIGCDDGDPCTVNDECSTGACEGTPLVDGADCDDGNPCTESDTCIDGFCFAQPVVAGVSCDDGDSCTALDACNESECVGGVDLCLCDGAANGTQCNDLDPCTTNDTCAGGDCVGEAKSCTFLDDDCNQGACNEETGACEPQPVLGGTDCFDGNPCTINDACNAGACVGAPKDCSGVEDTCHGSTCNEDTGACVAVALGNRSACNDNNPCTVGEVCNAGVCGGGAELCTACNGLALGDDCDDDSQCTSDDVCAQVQNALLCLGNAVDCSSLDAGCGVGTCVPATGACEIGLAADGVACEDGNPCTEGDSCSEGDCVGPLVRVCDVEPTVCEPFDDNDDASIATPIVLTPNADVVMRAHISTPGENDWYVVELLADEGFTAETLSDCGTALNTILSIYDGNGVDLLALNDDHDNTPWSRLENFTSSVDGTYYIQVGAYSASGTGAYNLRLAPGGLMSCNTTPDCGCAQLSCDDGKCVPASARELEPNNVFTQSTAAVLDGEVAGHLGATDVDFYAVTLSAGMPIDVETLALCNEAAVDTELTIYKPDGVSAAARNDDHDGSILSRVADFVAPTAGTYYIAVSSANFDSGRYRLAVHDRRCEQNADCGCVDQVCDIDVGETRGLCVPAQSESEPNESQSPMTLTVGQRVQASIGPAGDDDFYQIRLVPGTYDITTHDYCGRSVDTILTVWARDTHSLMGQDDDSGAGLLSSVDGFHVSVTRWFTIAVTARGSAVGSYVLQVQPSN